MKGSNMTAVAVASDSKSTVLEPPPVLPAPAANVAPTVMVQAPIPSPASPPAAQAMTVAESSDEPSRTLSAFSGRNEFVTAQRMAIALSQSSLVPAAYQGEGGIPNCMIAMELAHRIGASVFMVMQNLNIIHGKPGWASTFLIATVNASGRFTPLRFRWEGQVGDDKWGCRAVAKDKSDGDPCIGPLVTIGMAKAEGWMGKNGSKWKTLPELMMMYRSAAFWTRTYAPELSLGMQTADEVADIHGPDLSETPGMKPGDTRALEAELLGRDTTRIQMPSPPAEEAKAAEKGAAK